MSDVILPYSKSNPYLSSLKERYNLCKPGSNKNTHHLVLDLKGSGITYAVGDSVGIFPTNDFFLVEKTLGYMCATGDEIIHDKHTGRPHSVRDFLLTKANITEVQKNFVAEIANRQTNAAKKEALQELLKPENREMLSEYIDARELWDFLFENEEVVFTPQELCDRLLPLRCRFYSIASSQKQNPDEVHIAVASLAYDANGHLRKGVCTHYLCDYVPLNDPIVPLFIQPAHGFFLPEDTNIPIIMVGPGTGVAPYRAFMQERIATGAEGKNWLFFGEWNRDFDFFYEDYWSKLQSEGKLRLDTAFSRDQKEKIYVQHRLQEHASEIFDWLQQGAYFYVCGDAHRMAKDVESTLHQILQTAGGLSEQDAKAYVKQLRADKRYLRDVY
jgi:sulfite reductase (NADPH) flavoprotein alpha-component